MKVQISASVCPDLTTELDTVYSNVYDGDVVRGTKFNISCPEGQYFEEAIQIQDDNTTALVQIDDTVECVTDNTNRVEVWQWHADTTFALTGPKTCVGKYFIPTLDPHPYLIILRLLHGPYSF